MKRAVILLILGVFWVVSCEKKEPETDDVPFKHCACEEHADFTPSLTGVQYPEMDVYLFKDSIPKEIELDFYMSPDFVCWIIYFSKTDDRLHPYLHDVWMYFNRTNNWDLRGYGKVCNLPDITKKMTVPRNGIKVHVEGAMYHGCWPALGDVYAFDYVLSKFKILD